MQIGPHPELCIPHSAHCILHLRGARSLSPQTDYRIMEGVGHFLMLEKPAEFNATLTDMLRKFDLIGK
jgi:pimeloyl-ACP methyl ester carboxylesterase